MHGVPVASGIQDRVYHARDVSGVVEMERENDSRIRTLPQSESQRLSDLRVSDCARLLYANLRFEI